MLDYKLLFNIKRIIITFVMTLEDRDIIQVDASVIAGVLIFLTLTNVGQFKSPVFLTLLVIIPLSISAVLIGFENMKQGKSYEKYQFKGYALVFMIGGFIYLVAAVIMLFIGSFNIHK
jgi:hypothetical protein